MADSFQLKAIITAVDKVSAPLKGMQRQLKGFKKEFASLSLGAAGAGTAVLGALALPVKSAIALESKMADVRKVVDGLDTPEAFKAMTEQVRDLSTELPMSAEGIAEIVAAGGQAGIARDELMQFTDDAVKMGVAFDTTAEESGQMMAQWRTAFKLTQGEVAGLADKINYLGNTGPASAKKISDIVTRIGPLGSVAGVASGEIAAMGATIAGMGVESEIAATGIKNFMLSLTAGDSATKSQKKVLRSLRISPKKLAADMQKDARGAMLHVLDSLAKVPKEKQAAALNELFGKESSGSIAPLLTNLDLLRTNFNRVADAQQYGGSMQKEYAARAATGLFGKGGGVIGKAGVYGVLASMMWEPVENALESILPEGDVNWARDHGIYLASDWTPFFNRKNYEEYQASLNQPRQYKPNVPLLNPAISSVAARGEIKVTFDNAPQGMRVIDLPKTGDPFMKITHDVGYSPFRR